MEEQVIVGLVNTLSGLLFMLFSIPLSRRKIKMNDWYGFRFSKAFKSEENWYATNEFGARKLHRWSIFTMFTGILAFFLNFGGSGILSWLWVCVPITLLTLVPIVQTFKFSKKL